MYSTNAALFTTLWLMRFGTIKPSAVDRTVMTASAPMAPAKTIARGCRMAMIAAMMNVSSPSSDTRIIARLELNASPKPPDPSEFARGSACACVS